VVRGPPASTEPLITVPSITAGFARTDDAMFAYWTNIDGRVSPTILDCNLNIRRVMRFISASITAGPFVASRSMTSGVCRMRTRNILFSFPVLQSQHYFEKFVRSIPARHQWRHETSAHV